MAPSKTAPLSISRTGLTLVEPYVVELDKKPMSLHQKQRVNVVFVHGLKGHPRHTWEVHDEHNSSLARLFKLFRGPSAKSASAPEGRPSECQNITEDFWPAAKLSREVPEARVWTYGYDADVISFFTGANKNGITQHGQDMMIKLERSLQNEDPIIFVAHSLGGLVVKWAMRQMRASRVAKYMECHSRIHAVIFCGTPHRGSSWVQLASNLTRVAIMDSNSRLLKDLAVDAEILNLVQKDFLSLIDEFPIIIHSFLEGRPMTGVRGFNSKIVDDFSAEVGYRNETVETINGNHRTMVRGEGAREICAVIRNLVHGALLRETNTVQNTAELLTADNSHDLKYNKRVKMITERCILGSLEFPTMNDRYSGIEVAHRSVVHSHKSTFDWIFERTDLGFVDWLHHGNGIFWINGKAGSGKSTLMKFIADDKRLLDHLKDSGDGQGHIVCVDFYFWAGGSSDQRALSGLLRSFLYRVLEQCKDLMPAVCPEEWSRYRSAVTKKLSKVQAEEMEKLENELHELKQEVDRLVNEHQMLKQQKDELIPKQIQAIESLVKQLQKEGQREEPAVNRLQQGMEEESEEQREELQKMALLKKFEREIKAKKTELRQLPQEMREKELRVQQAQENIQKWNGARMVEIAYQRAADKVTRQLATTNQRWTHDDLLQRFHGTLAKLPSSHTLFLLVDGLDEYEATEEEIEALVKLLKKAGQRPNSRICVSTRPLTLFENHFGRGKYPSLRLQDLTIGDIQLFVKDAFDQSSLMETARNTNSNIMPDFYSIIVRKAEGVFLWVRLVVKMLLRGLKNGEEFLELRRMVEELPHDLERLYRHMFDRIETKYWVRSSKIFSIVNAAQEPPSALMVWYCGDSNANPLERLPETTKKANCYSVYLRLMSQCAGLLELRQSSAFRDGGDDSDDESDDDGARFLEEALMDDDLLQPINFPPEHQQQHYLRSTVHYMHRTAKEFIISVEIRALVQSRLDSGTERTLNVQVPAFDPHKWLAVQTLVRLRHFMATNPSLQDEELVIDTSGTLEFHSQRNLQHISYLRKMVDKYGARCTDKAIAARLQSAAEEICCGDWSSLGDQDRDTAEPTQLVSPNTCDAWSSIQRALQGRSLPIEIGPGRRPIQGGYSNGDIFGMDFSESSPKGEGVNLNNTFDTELRSLLQEEGVNFGQKSSRKRRQVPGHLPT